MVSPTLAGIAAGFGAETAVLTGAGTRAEILPGAGVGIGNGRLGFTLGRTLAVSIHSGAIIDGKTEIKLL